jgi:hypothetical protein
MNFRHWFKRDVIIPNFLLIVFGVGMFWLTRQLMQLKSFRESSWMLLLLLFGILLYLMLAIVTVRHVLSTYSLERFDPGDPASLKRLVRLLRYRLPGRSRYSEGLTRAVLQELHRHGYYEEAHNHAIGTVLLRTRRNPITRRLRYTRVILADLTPVNVLMVDQLLKDSIRYIRNQTKSPSTRNSLVIITHMADPIEVASAAAGVVNFLGLFQGGSLSANLLDTKGWRQYYPIDQTMLPRLQQFFARWIRTLLVRAAVASSKSQTN